MNASNKLLDKYATTCLLPSDKAIAEALRVKQSAVSNWRHKRAHPNAQAIERMCTATGEPLAKWVATIEADRARTPADRKVWERIAAAALIVLVVGGTSPTASAHLSADNSGHSVYYVKWSIRLRRFRSLCVSCWDWIKRVTDGTPQTTIRMAI